MASSKRALHLRGGAVDLVGQQQVREDRPLVDAELVGPLVEDLRADDVGRKQVDGELDAGEMEVDRLGEDRDQQGLGQPGHALKQQVAAGEQGDQQPLDDHVLADDHGPHALADRADELERLSGNLPRTGLARGRMFDNAHDPEISQQECGRRFQKPTLPRSGATWT